MRNALLTLAGVTLVAVPLSAQTADGIVANYTKAIGGADAIQAVKTLRRTGKSIGSDGVQAVVVQENKRPTKVREEFSLQGMTGIDAYDGKAGWKIQPWQGKKDPEALSEEEMRVIVEDADFDDPLINYREKGNKVDLVGTDQIEGTPVYKLKVTLASADTRYYYIDTDSYVPIKIESKRTIRGADHESEASLGDYKKVNGWYLPHSIETNTKGSQDKQKVTYDRIEANVAIADQRFEKPVAHAGTQQQPAAPLDASNATSKKPEPPKPPAAPAAKPPLHGRAGR